MTTATDKKVKVHTIYKNAAGIKVPGVTTALRVIDKSGPLIHWAWKLGMDGIDYKKVRDKAADIGTLSHYLIECHIKGETPELDEYSKADIDKAENAYLSYLDWEKEHKVMPRATEQQLVSEQYQYGGTIDLVAKSGDKTLLIDFKTSNGIYKEMEYQVAAYRQLVAENTEWQPDEHYILQIPKSEDGEFTYKKLGDLKAEFAVFEAALVLYNAIRKAK